METFRIILGNGDRRINNLIEIAARDVCYNQAVVEFVATGRLDDVVERSFRTPFALAILVPDDLAPGCGRKASRLTTKETADAIRTLKHHWNLPVIVLSRSVENELPLLEAGADRVLSVLFNAEVFKSELRRVLRLREPEPEEPEPAPRFSLASFLFRSVQRKAA